MKMFSLTPILTIISLLSACHNPANINPHNVFMKDGAGADIQNCETGHPVASEVYFWKKNNLPYGTVDYVCKDKKAYLPVDCQGNSLNYEQIRAYWEEYSLNKGITVFTCVNGKPINPE